MRIVAGVSATADSHPAIDWAMEHATAASDTVELVHVVDDTMSDVPDSYTESALLAAERELRDRAEQVKQARPGLAVEAHVRMGAPARELIEAAGRANLLVIGSHREPGHSASRRTVRLAGLAPCSVVVVPHEPKDAGSGVVVGIDGSADSDRAVEFAAQLADRYREPLTAIYALSHPEPWGLVEPYLNYIQPTESDRLVLAEAIAGLSSTYPDLEIRSEVVLGTPAEALSTAARGARMLVVGSHGRHGLPRMLLGSVSESVAAALPCAVAVIRRGASDSTGPSTLPSTEAERDRGTARDARHEKGKK